MTTALTAPLADPGLILCARPYRVRPASADAPSADLPAAARDLLAYLKPVVSPADAAPTPGAMILAKKLDALEDALAAKDAAGKGGQS